MQPEMSLRVYSSRLLISVLSQIDPIHIIPSYFFQNHFIMILQPIPSSFKLFSPSGFRTKLLYALIFFPMCAICAADPFFCMNIQLIFVEEMKTEEEFGISFFSCVISSQFQIQFLSRSCHCSLVICYGG
jgi:hypothetical protein